MGSKFDWCELITEAASKYPLPPPPVGNADELLLAHAIPNVSAVYFFWRQGQCEYVGQSVRLVGRISTHNRLLERDSLSWLEWDRRDLDYVESFYIGALRPIRNFMGSNRFTAYRKSIREQTRIAARNRKQRAIQRFESDVGCSIAEWEDMRGVVFESVEQARQIESKFGRKRKYKQKYGRGDASIGEVLENLVRQWESETGLKFESIGKVMEMERERMLKMAKGDIDPHLRPDT